MVWGGWIGVPEDVVGSRAPEDGDVRHCGGSLGGGIDGGRVLMLELSSSWRGRTKDVTDM